MAGVVTQSAGLVRQKAYNAVYGTGTGTTTDSVSPYHFYAIKALFLHLAANKNNPDLQFIPYAAEDVTATEGYQPLGAGAVTLYAWFAKARRTSGTTASWEEIFDLATDDTVTAIVAANRINLTGQQFLQVWPNGVALATELTISSNTGIATDTNSAAADSTDGFVIVGA
jgi:2-hydroxychromene-2-carboxylate isomerase